jgi:4-diphosphocytidyl-2-C-methyl-D-erythritol kinase
VPFCVIGGTKITRGRGERMSDMPKMPDCPMVIAIGDDHVSTPAQFAELDRRFDNFSRYEVKTECVDKIRTAFSEGSFDIGDGLYNIFEITGRFSPEIKEIMHSCGARGTLMSGSGSSVFGIFKDDSAAELAKEKLTEKGYRAFLCRPVKKAYERSSF